MKHAKHIVDTKLVTGLIVLCTRCGKDFELHLPTMGMRTGLDVLAEFYKDHKRCRGRGMETQTLGDT